MVRAARGGAAAAVPQVAGRDVTLWDAHTAGQIGRDQMRSISLLHEGFARNLTHSLGAYLRTAFTAALVSADSRKRVFHGRISPLSLPSAPMKP